jgi:replicative superfamily II helicase
LTDANERINSFENEKKAQEAVARFNLRMDELDSKFELADEDREFLANEVKSIDETEEAFASYSDKLEVLWKHKSKAHKEAFEAEVQARIDEEVEKRIATASTEEVNVEAALDNATQTDADISNNNEALASEQEESFADKFKKAFSRENIEITR